MSGESPGHQRLSADGSSVQYASQYGSVHINNYYGPPPPDPGRPPRQRPLGPDVPRSSTVGQWFRRYRRWAVARSRRPRDAGWAGGCLVPLVFWFSAMMLAARGVDPESTDPGQGVLIRSMVTVLGGVFYVVWGMSVRLPRERAAASGIGFFLVTGVLLAFVEDALAWFGVAFCLATGLCLYIGVRAMRRRQGHTPRR